MNNESKSTLSKTPLYLRQKSPTYYQKGLNTISDYGGSKESQCVKEQRKSKYEVEDIVLTGLPIIQKFQRKPEKQWTPESKEEELVLVLDGIRFDCLADKEDYRAYKSKNLEELKQIKLWQNITTKNPSSWISGLTSNYFKKSKILGKETWTHREVEWSRAERRLLFSTNDEELCNNWVYLLNWLKRRQGCS